MTDSKRNRWKYISILILLMILLTIFRLLWLAYHDPPPHPAAQNGLLDLREYNLGDSPVINLDGEWDFYPEQLVSPQTLNSDADGTRKIPKAADETSTRQFGTYHLKIVMNEHSDEVFSIRVPSTNTASALYINGQFKGGSGTVSDNKEDHVGKGSPYVVSFSVENNEIDIVLHISNFDTSYGIAVKNPIKFGSSEAMAKKQNFEHILLIGMVVILFLHSLYCVLIYVFIHRNKIFLIFAVGFLLPATDELITYNSSTMEWLHFNYEWSFKFKELIYLGAALFLVQIMSVLLTDFRSYRRLRWFVICYGISALLIVILPLRYLLQIDIIFFILYTVSFLSVASLALKEYFQYNNESFFIAVVIIGTTSGILWGLIKELFDLEIPFYPFDYLCAILGLAVFWFKRFYRQSRQVAELVDELKRADQLKDDFLTSSTRKIWNPLNKMTTIAQTLYDRDNSSMTNKYKSDLKYIINIGKSMSFALNDLLDFTRLKEQMIQIHPKSINLHAVIASVFDMLKYSAEGNQTELTSAIPAHLPNVWADESRLVQIFFNILGSAMKCTYSGKIIVHAKVIDHMAVIYVQETGALMDKEAREKLKAAYSKGFQDDEALELGLKVSERLIELHGGSLKLKSEAGLETQFIITLPLASKQEQPDNELEFSPAESTDKAKESKKENSVSSKTRHILVVDDDPSNLVMISRIFPSDQYRVATVTSGTEALKLLNAEEWDLFIIDVTMPFMSGYELTELIRERYSIIELPILLLTSRNYTEDINVGFTLGANDYVAKPINALELKSRSIALIHLKQSIIEKHYMESAWLQAQIRPHFLFNTLNAISSLSTIDSDRMDILLEKFGEYLYGSFKEENLKQVIPIENELNLVKSYLYIESERFGDRIQIKWEVDEHIDIEIPPLSIQTLVENAVRHGILNKGSSGTICIRIADNKEYTKIQIIDDGVGMEQEQISKIYDDSNTVGQGIGLVNTNRRLKRLYGTGLKIKSTPNMGTTVEFIIPKNAASSSLYA